MWDFIYNKHNIIFEIIEDRNFVDSDLINFISKHNLNQKLQLNVVLMDQEQKALKEDFKKYFSLPYHSNLEEINKNKITKLRIKFYQILVYNHVNKDINLYLLHD